MPENETTKEGKPRAAAAAAADIILEAMVDGVVIMDLDGNIIQENKAHSKMYGYQTLVGKNITELVAKEDLPHVLEEIKKMTAGIASKNLEFSGITQDGKRFPVLFNGIILKDEKGKVVGILGVIRDITELKKAQEEINTEKIRINATLQNLNEGVVAFDANGNVILVNPMITKLTGLPEKGFSIGEFIKLFKGVDVEAKIKIALAKRQKTHIEEITLIGRFFYEMFFTPIIDPQDNTIGSAIVLHDITRIKEIERIKTEFISTASHQLRTPLTGIRWVAEMMTKKEKLTDKGREYLNDIQTSTRRLTRLVDLLLNTSRIEEGQITIFPQSLDVVNFIKSFVSECASLCDKKGIALKFTTDLKNLMVMTDLGAFTNIIQSIISNAMEYTLKGRIEVKLSRAEPRTEPMDIGSGAGVKLSAKGGSASGGKKQGQTFLFTVSDTGVGIPEAEQKKIFQKFGRASNAQYYKTDGTGLGLYIAKQAVELLGGKIWFKSKENKGTTFFVELPIESKSIKGTKQLV